MGHKQKRVVWTKKDIDDYFEGSREIESARRGYDQLDLAIERHDTRSNNRRRAKRQPRKA